MIITNYYIDLELPTISTKLPLPYVLCHQEAQAVHQIHDHPIKFKQSYWQGNMQDDAQMITWVYFPCVIDSF